VDAGTRYLRQLLEKYHGGLWHALAAYNAGPGAVDRFGGVPPYAETLEYVRRVQRGWKPDF
jgi:soluble lytic murein transglycosylase-like protein